ncbi:MAG TPA: acetylxylan esterase [Verrucomicrobiae bacterium]|jgi:dienelactone hydrolase
MFPSHDVRRLGISFACIFLAARLIASEGGQREIREWLERPILAPDQPLHEVQAFCEARVPLMPAVRSVAEWERYAEKTRRDVLDKVVFRGARARRWRDAKTDVVWLETIPGGPGYRITKLRYEALPGLWIPALLYEPEHVSGKVPVHLAVNGHDGNGKAAPYKQIRCINLAKRGMVVLNVEWLGMGQLRTAGFQHYKMNQLDLCGVSGLAPYYLAMSRGLDVLLKHPNADPERVAVSGLSGGGWQTIFISSLDPRVKLCNPVAGYSSYLTRARFTSDLGDSEQTPNDLATVTDFAPLTAMMAGRAALLTFNAKDGCCFRADHALIPLQQAAGPIFDLYGQAKRLRSHINFDPGTHNYERDNREAFYRMVGDVFFPGDAKFDAKDIACDDEVKTNVVLNVELPADNTDFHQLAVAASANLPRDPKFAENNPTAARRKLAEIVKFREDAVKAQRIGAERSGSKTVWFWALKVGEFTVPAVEITRGEPKGTVVLVADAGRKSLAAEVEELLSRSNRVIAIDPFYFGESKISQRDFLYALLTACVGERPLGLQAGQMAAVARWAKEEFKQGAVTLVVRGERTSLSALLAAALERGAIGKVDVHDGLKSLHEIIDQDGTVDKRPEMFCFGLLESFDIPQLKQLVGKQRLVE